MKRRTVLASLAALAGCSVPGETTEESSGGPAISRGAAPEGISIAIDVTGRFDETSPGQLTFTLENTSDSAQTYTFGATPPWSTYLGEHATSDAILVLFPQESEHVGVEDGPAIQHAGGDCWRLGGDLVVDDVALERTLEPGESLTRTYAMLADSTGEPCLPDGEYRFDQQYYVNGRVWGFTVTIDSTIRTGD